MEHCIEELKNHFAYRLQSSILTKGRNQGLVCVKIAPILSIFWNQMFANVADDFNETWIKKTVLTPNGKKTTIVILDYFAGLDNLLGGSTWRRTDIYIPYPGSPTGKLLDGYWELNSHKPVRITYNHVTLSLTISYHVCQYNKNGVFQGCQ